MCMADYFSTQASLYRKYRPTYPASWYAWLVDQLECRDLAWDCGTGNGQVARVLAEQVERVVATDISKAQLDRAPTHARIDYRLGDASSVDVASASVDLVTVAQAVHWFDVAAFNREVTAYYGPAGWSPGGGMSYCA